MKKHVVFLMAMLFSASVFCQDQPGEAEKKLRFGIKAGVAFADQQYENNQTLSIMVIRPVVWLAFL
jgi:hypothetical protein